ncbi:hypothetical protein ACWCQZ_44305 [Streptomyces sp. NPDC002285]
MSSTPQAQPALGNMNATVAEQHRIERIVSGLKAGESTVINGTEVTVVSLAVACAHDVLAEAQGISPADPIATARVMGRLQATVEQLLELVEAQQADALAQPGVA